MAAVIFRARVAGALTHPGKFYRSIPAAFTLLLLPSFSSQSSSRLSNRTFLGCQTSPSLLFRSGALTSSAPGMGIGRVGASAFSGSVNSPTSSSVKTTPEDVIQFWFKDIDPENGIYKSMVWFTGGPAFDNKCDETFGESLKLASSGGLDEWMATIQGRLALVILLDQFSRNVYRNSASSFSQDERALKVTMDTINQGWDKKLKPWERWFLYMPLMHSEKLEDHDIADRVYQELADEHSDNPQLFEELTGILEFERKHSAVIKRFGRYPARNTDLGRQSTREEEEFLASGGNW